MSSPGPRCKADIRCATCRERTHKGQLKCKRSAWLPGCSACNWYPERIFSNRQEAYLFWRAHKHDDSRTWSEAMQTALKNLVDQGLTNG